MNYLLDFYNETRSTLLKYANKLDIANGEDIYTDCHLKVCEEYNPEDLDDYKKLMYTCILNNVRNRRKIKISELSETTQRLELCSMDDQMFKNQEIRSMLKALETFPAVDRHRILEYKKGGTGAYRQSVSRLRKELKNKIEEMN